MVRRRRVAVGNNSLIRNPPRPQSARERFPVRQRQFRSFRSVDNVPFGRQHLIWLVHATQHNRRAVGELVRLPDATNDGALRKDRVIRFQDIPFPRHKYRFRQGFASFADDENAGSSVFPANPIQEREVGERLARSGRPRHQTFRSFRVEPAGNTAEKCEFRIVATEFIRPR